MKLGQRLNNIHAHFLGQRMNNLNNSSLGQRLNINSLNLLRNSAPSPIKKVYSILEKSNARKRI
jgi:hypothetical protein